jgi:hypothetical protein
MSVFSDAGIVFGVACGDFGDGVVCFGKTACCFTSWSATERVLNSTEVLVKL